MQATVILASVFRILLAALRDAPNYRHRKLYPQKKTRGNDIQMSDAVVAQIITDIMLRSL